MATPDFDPVDAVAEAFARMRGRGPRGDAPHGAHPHEHTRGRGGRDRLRHDRGHDHGHDHGGPHDPRAAMFDGPRGAGPARMRMLGALMAADGALSVSELAAAVGVDQPRASRLVQQGVELGLVERQTDPDDARRTRIALTDRGSAMARGIRTQRREAIRDALAVLTAEEQAEFARLFAKFAAAWPQR